jgi:hypothetical protein
MDVTTFAQTDLPLLVQIAGAVDILEEAGLTIIASLHDVLRHTGKIKSRLAGHRQPSAGKFAQSASHPSHLSVRRRPTSPSESAH